MVKLKGRTNVIFVLESKKSTSWGRCVLDTAWVKKTSEVMYRIIKSLYYRPETNITL